MLSPKVGIVVQARMGSSRLPGKVLKPLDGRPMLARILERLRSVDAGVPVIVATTEAARDQAVANQAASWGAPVFRGSESDVLDRYHRCAEAHGLAHVVRATGDNPFVDPEEARRLIAFHLAGGFEYSENVTSGLPVGVGVEVFSAAALRRCWAEGRENHHREHVNEFILEHPGSFRTGTLAPPPDKVAPGLRLTVDTPDEFQRAEDILRVLARRGEPVTTERIITWCHRREDESP